jgi:hypothetical protein
MAERLAACFGSFLHHGVGTAIYCYFWIWTTPVPCYMKRQCSASYVYVFLHCRVDDVPKEGAVGHLEVYRLAPYSL